jgi:hypothetical protein
MAFLRDAMLANQDVLANQEITIPIPFMNSFPLEPLAKLGRFFNVSECNEWYMFQFRPDTPHEDRLFFGENEGSPSGTWRSEKSFGMLKGGENILEMPCGQINRTVPYFKELDPKIGRPNEVVYDAVQKLSAESLKMELRNQAIAGLEKVPDGILTVAEANTERFTY